MKYRLLALDLDGTLLNSRKEVTPEVKQALRWAKERGVHVVLSTGLRFFDGSSIVHLLVLCQSLS